MQRYVPFARRRSAPCRWLASLVMAASVTAVAHAQDASSIRFTARPESMKLGTRNPAAGAYAVNGVGDSIYIPPQAVGEHRVPVILQFGADVSRWRAMADSFGMAVVLLQEGMGDVLGGGGFQPIDEALRNILGNYAIDPKRIAIMGLSNGGYLAEMIACANLDVISRIGLMSPIGGPLPPCADVTRAPAERTQVYLSVATGEPKGVVADVVTLAAKVRQAGHPVRHVLDLRWHRNRRQDYGNVWQWLTESWASPEATAKAGLADPASQHLGDSVAVLDSVAMTKMTDFWREFRQRHPLDETFALDGWPVPNRKTIPIPVAAERMTSFDMVDLQAVAAKDAEVAKGLAKVGLTMSQEELYRIALVSARTTLVARRDLPDLPATPAIDRNVKFLSQRMNASDTLLDLVGALRCETSGQEDMEPGSC